jgi:flagella basal body P-ring formation protein FlgA
MKLCTLNSVKFVRALATLGAVSLVFASSIIWADDTQCSSVSALQECIQRALATRWPDAKVALTSEVRWSSASQVSVELSSLEQISLQILSDQENGTARIRVGNSNAIVQFQALKKIWAPIRRFYPGQPIQASDLVELNVDVARSPHRENRYLYLASAAAPDALEAKQSLLENTPIQAHAVQPRPDIRRGDALQAELTLGGIVLGARAQALENGHKGSRVRILLEKQRRELVGVLRPDGTVEVRL